MTLSRQRSTSRGLTLAALLLSVSALPLHAQEEAGTIMLGTIYITGAKRVQDQLSFPGTVAQIGGEEAASAGVTGVDGIDRLFPGVAVDARSSRVYANFTVRGQASLDFYNPSVQLYVDGLPQDAATLGQMFPVGLETVEMLYGPQGTLYGRGAVGGVVNVTTVKPGEGTPFFVGVAGGNGGYSFGLKGEAKLGEGLWADLSLGRNRQDDDLTGMMSGAPLGGTTESRAQLRLRYAPEGSPWDVMFTAARNEVSSTEEQFVMGTALDARQAVPFPSFYDHDTTSLGLTASYDLGWGELTSVTGWQDRFLDRTIFGSYTPEWQETLTQEFRLSSTGEGPVDYVAGLFFSRSDFRREAYGSATDQRTRSFAAFADLTWHVSDRFSITPGLRFDYEETEASASGLVTLNAKDDWSAVSPKLGFSYEISPEWQGYGLISSGFKAGGFTRTLTAANIAYTYDPSKTWNAEVGLKYQSADGALQAQVAAYWSRTDDYQMFVGTAPAQYLQNVGEVTAKGIDASLRYASGGWGISGGVSLTDSKFTGYADPTNPAASYEGNRVPYAPKATARLAVDYTFDLGPGKGQLVPRIGVTHQGKIWFDEGNAIGQDSYTLLDAGIAWKMENGAVLDFYATNLTDKTYASYGFDASAYGLGNVYQLGRGREIGIRFTKSF